MCTYLGYTGYAYDHQEIVYTILENRPAVVKPAKSYARMAMRCRFE